MKFPYVFQLNEILAGLFSIFQLKKSSLPLKMINNEYSELNVNIKISYCNLLNLALFR